MKTSIDKLFFGKNIYTMVAEDDKVEAIAVKDGKIVFAGAKAEAEETKREEVRTEGKAKRTNAAAIKAAAKKNNKKAA